MMVNRYFVCLTIFYQFLKFPYTGDIIKIEAKNNRSFFNEFLSFSFLFLIYQHLLIIWHPVKKFRVHIRSDHLCFVSHFRQHPVQGK